MKRTKSWSILTGASSRLDPHCTIQPKKLCSLIKGNLCQRRLKQLCRWFVFYLRGEVTNFHLHQRGACNEARFISDALYILALRMTEKVSMIMNTERKNMVENAAFFITICYAPWFLKSYLVNKSTSNDINAIKSAFHTS